MSRYVYSNLVADAKSSFETFQGTLEGKLGLNVNNALLKHRRVPDANAAPVIPDLSSARVENNTQLVDKLCVVRLHGLDRIRSDAVRVT